MSAQLLFIPHGGGGGPVGPVTGCIPMLKNMGDVVGAAFSAAAAFPDGASAQDRGIFLLAAVGALHNRQTADTETVLAVLESTVDPSNHLALLYRRDPSGGALVVQYNGQDLFSHPAPVATHPVLFGAVLIPQDGFEPEKAALIVGSTVAQEKALNIGGGFPVGATMRVRVAEQIGGASKSNTGFEVGGALAGVPPVAFTSGDPVAVAVAPAVLSGKLEDTVVGLVGAQVWSSTAFESDNTIDPWPEANGGTGLARRDQATPIYYANCTPGWGVDQGAAKGSNLGSGWEVFQDEASTPGDLRFRSLTGSGGISLSTTDTELNIGLNAQGARSFGGIVFDGHTPWKLPDTLTKVANLVTAGSGVGQDFVENADGTLTYQGSAKIFQIHATLSVKRDSGVDSNGTFTLAVGNPATVATGVAQELRFGLTGASEVIDLQALVSLDFDDKIEVWADTNAPTNGLGLTIEIVGFTMTVAEA